MCLPDAALRASKYFKAGSSPRAVLPPRDVWQPLDTSVVVIPTVGAREAVPHPQCPSLAPSVHGAKGETAVERTSAI